MAVVRLLRERGYYEVVVLVVGRALQESACLSPFLKLAAAFPSSCFSSFNVVVTWSVIVASVALATEIAFRIPLTPLASGRSSSPSAPRPGWTTADRRAVSPDRPCRSVASPRFFKSSRSLVVADLASWRRSSVPLREVPGRDGVCGRGDRVLPGRDRRAEVARPGGRRIGFVLSASAGKQRHAEERQKARVLCTVGTLTRRWVDDHHPSG